MSVQTSCPFFCYLSFLKLICRVLIVFWIAVLCLCIADTFSSLWLFFTFSLSVYIGVALVIWTLEELNLVTCTSHLLPWSSEYPWHLPLTLLISLCLAPGPPAQLPSTVRPAAPVSYEGWLEMHLLASHLRPLESQSPLLARSLGDSCSHSSLKSIALASSTRLSHRHLLWKLSKPASPLKALSQGRLYSPTRIRGNRTSP